MNLLRLGKWIAVGIVVLVIFTYGVYAMKYQGNYDVGVSFVLTVPEMGEAQIIEFDYASEPTSVLSFWELRGKSGTPVSSVYTMYAEWNQSGEIDTVMVDVPVAIDSAVTTPTERVDISFTFFNKSPGTAHVRLYIQWEYTNSIIFDQTYPVVVG